MIPRFLNLQGMIGIAGALLLLALFLVKAGEARHWRKQSGRYEQLYHGEQGLEPRRSPTIAPPPTPRARKIWPTPGGSPPSSAPSLKGRVMTSKHALPMLALALSCCSSGKDRPQPLAAVAEQRLCPPPAQPPARLVVPPKKTDFLSPTAFSRRSRPSSSTS